MYKRAERKSETLKQKGKKLPELKRTRMYTQENSLKKATSPKRTALVKGQLFRNYQ